jgi:uncharacterized membrane-anchored protein YhcB (DUF1043 family)
MMEPIWQNIIMAVVVAVAVAYLAVYFVRKRRKKKPCARCLEQIKKLHNN